MTLTLCLFRHGHLWRGSQASRFASRTAFYYVGHFWANENWKRKMQNVDWEINISSTLMATVDLFGELFSISHVYSTRAVLVYMILANNITLLLFKVSKMLHVAWYVSWSYLAKIIVKDDDSANVRVPVSIIKVGVQYLPTLKAGVQMTKSGVQKSWGTDDKKWGTEKQSHTLDQ